MFDGIFGDEKQKTDSEREFLLTQFQEKNAQLVEVIDQFYAQSPSGETRLTLCEKVIDLCRGLIEAGDWSSSPFLVKVIGPVRETLHRMEAIQRDLSSNGRVSASVETSIVNAGKTQLFISIYQAQGRDIKRWELLLRSLSTFYLGRPVYDDIAKAQAWVRSKSDPSTEAFVEVWVNSSAISENPTYKRVDKLGQDLVNLSPGILKKEDIICFYHLNKCYDFKDNILIIRKDDQ